MGANYFIFVMGDSIKTYTYAKNIKEHIDENNLNLPFPNPLFNYTENPDLLNAIYEMNLTEFTELVKTNYIYSENEYDCKYWAYVWTLYWNNNLYKKGYNLEYIDINNHVFVIVYTDIEYCLFDGDNVICYNLT